MYKILILATLVSGAVGAQSEMDKDTSEAVEQTKNLLKDRKSRESAAQSSQDSKDVMKNVKDLAGGAQNEQEIYEIASEVFEQLMKKHNGDMSKVMAEMQELQKNPKKLYEMAKPETVAKIKNVSQKIENRQPAGAKSKP